MDVTQLCGLSLVALVALLLIRQAKPEWAPLLRIAVAVVAVGGVLGLLVEVLAAVAELGGLTGSHALPPEAWGILLRALGVAFLTECAAAVCRDCGEGTLASFVELAGKLEILILSFPLIRTVLETAAGLLGGG